MAQLVLIKSKSEDTPRISSSSERHPVDAVRISRSGSKKKSISKKQTDPATTPENTGKSSSQPIPTVKVHDTDEVKESQQSESAGEPPKSDSNGFLSSLLNAAHNAAHNAATAIGSNPAETDENQENQVAATSTPEKNSNPEHESKSKRDTFSNKFDFLMKPARFSSSKSTPDDHEGSINGQILTLSLNEKKDLNIAPTSSTANVQFEPVRESPLNSIGHGDLTLDSFEQTKTSDSFDLLGSSTNGTTNSFANVASLIPGAPSRSRRSDSLTKRIMITPNHSSDNLHDKKAMSPDVVSRNGDSKKAHRKSICNSNTDLVKLKSQTSRQRSVDQEDDVQATEDSESEVSKDQELESVDYSKMKYAPKKKNREFHEIFKSVPKDDKMVEDVSCALSKDFLVQGRMYISDHYICFNSNILGWVTNLTIPLQEVIQIEKKQTAVLFPNGMIIRTLHHKYVFATFLSRDTTFNLISNIWNRVLSEGDGDPGRSNLVKRRTRTTRTGSKSISDSRERDVSTGGTDEDDVSDYSDEHLHGDSGDGESSEGSADDNNLSDNDSKQSGSDISSESDEEDEEASPAEDGSSTNDTQPEKPKDGKDGFNGFPLLGPATHAPTSTGYTKDAAETFICEDVIKAPLGVVYGILFGNDTSKFIKILKALENFDVSESGVTPISTKQKDRHYSYIKPLHGSIGPKQTKCVCEDKLVEYDLEKYILVEQITATPDVPLGNSFKIRTKVFLSWAPNNQTKYYVVTGIEWSAKSWIKGAIERGSIDGQKETMKAMVKQMNDMIAQGNKGSSKKSKAPKKKSRSRKSTVSRRDTSNSTSSAENGRSQSKGVFEQLTELLESIGKSIPVSIPYISDMIVGIIILTIGFLAFFKIGSKITGGNNNDRLSVDNFNTGDISRIMINNEKYLVIPSIDTSYNNNKMKMDTEVELWNWIKERSAEKINIKNTDSSRDKKEIYEEYSDQEIREIIKVTKLKLEKLSERLNISD